MMLSKWLKLLSSKSDGFLLKSSSVCKSEGKLWTVELLYTSQETGYLLGISSVKQIAWHGLHIGKI